MDKEIKDPDGILKVITALFGKLPAYIVNSDKEYPVKIIALKNKALVINTNLKFPNRDRILTVVHNGSKFLAHFLVAGGDGNGIEILTPVKIQITAATRQGSRVEASQIQTGMVVSNIINVNDVSKAIGFDDKKVDAILLAYRTKLAKAFPLSSIFFAGRMDNRLRLMHHYDKDIFIIDRKEKSTASPDFFPFDEYLRIFDNSKIPDSYTSEICAPIKYKGYVHLGYVQVLSEKPLDLEIYKQIQTFANAVSRDIIITGVFQESRDICQVMDLSMGGISFIHAPSRSFSRSVTMNGTILFDLNLEEGKRVTIRGIIKNIRNQETNFRVGCQFYNLTEKDLEILGEFLQSGKAEEETTPEQNNPEESQSDPKEEDNSSVVGVADEPGDPFGETLDSEFPTDESKTES
ncbi:PilZ domain-containing protein [Leptospira sp. 2 VSF19]|uniref:PilZ domain-containing protein n=1 Tax=Leptospira soteropolitanensis TaxID=2950025 RepID=A0AAW5VKJ8_9LEPT|nr:PilZ domain-containing protein [Leptospira soteropolitanensis]MCW7492916.1 PilZ domain-containing protein [Leptospira soteropolitanensis]MCW7500151.1 PilZ domain-containing protein [Leptospira soteropolitanensis]MCW7522402.1 PilZ domain-containing protein [Leptospira soteropolitanensis]MCW7526258.1 PilZ domain-containing protein [Leptospira soteropolitanensis]MCW7529630.1 PilZ domain-containing protein [Leptospira soteropolitanensis]